MQCVLREKFLIQAMKLADVSRVFHAKNHSFVDAYIGWLEEAEKDLSSLRSTISILLQAEKSSLNSVLYGYLPNNVQAGKSIRKIQIAAAAQSLEKISKELYSKIENINLFFDQLNEKLCHAIAILASKEPEIYKKLQLNQQGVDTLWKKLSITPETLPMYNYFCAKLTSTDINYLLMDIIQKIVSHNKLQAD
jgi:hypothetical protein